MNLLFWNCRGLGNLRIEKELVSILRAKDPSVVFIAETWADEARLERTLSNINFDQKWVVPRTTRGGGLVLFWKNLWEAGPERKFPQPTLPLNSQYSL